MANARHSKVQTVNASQSTPQRPTRMVRAKPKPKPKAKGKKVREATPSGPEGEEEEEDHNGDSQSDADQGALQSKIETLEHQLKTRKKGRSVDALQDVRLEASRKCSLAMLDDEGEEDEEEASNAGENG
ncbi:hypothetical protein BDR06DRAFT_1008154 [Suillus hirtellus]|nr:hypothetical protein BDR06DRAFT_1008154 [Suillus hirtellus]